MIMKKIAVVGYKGKMGSLIYLALQNEFIVFGVDRENCLENFDVDIVVDFASHESSVVSARFCLKNRIPLIIGSTGQTDDESKEIYEISKYIKILKLANFAKGIDILKNFIENVLMLNPDRFEIIEKHHKNKKDAPSGTAKELKNFISDRFSGEVKITSIREGEEMGEHTIIAYCGDEKLKITHNVYSRNVFVFGVVKGVKSLLKE